MELFVTVLILCGFEVYIVAEHNVIRGPVSSRHKVPLKSACAIALSILMEKCMLIHCN